MINISNIKSYIINLEKYDNKYNLCLKRLAKINIKPERFNAIYVENENDEEIKKITYPSVQYTIKNGRNAHNEIGSKGAIGCYLSHITLWQMLVDSDEEMFLIFEDDVDINKNINNFTNKINKTINLINNNDWDVIYLGHSTFNLQYNNKSYFKINNLIYGLQSYIINKKGARKLLESALPIVDQIDSYMSYMAINRNVNSYATTELFFIQNNIKKSTIQTDYSIKPFITQFDNNTVLGIIMLILICFCLLCQKVIKTNKN